MAEQDPKFGPNFLLSDVEQEVIDSFERHPPDFDELFNRLKEEKPRLAWFLLRRAEKLAPRDAQDKERYATIALEIAGLISAQVVVDGLRETFALDSENASSPDTAKHDGDEVRPPAA